MACSVFHFSYGIKYLWCFIEKKAHNNNSWGHHLHKKLYQCYNTALHCACCHIYFWLEMCQNSVDLTLQLDQTFLCRKMWSGPETEMLTLFLWYHFFSLPPGSWGHFHALIAFKFCVFPFLSFTLKCLTFLLLHGQTWWKVMVAFPGIFVCVTIAIPQPYPHVYYCNLADIRHHFIQIQPCIWGLFNSALNGNKSHADVFKKV